MPLNYHTQGTACEAALKAFFKVDDYFQRLNLKDPRADYGIPLYVHDELVFDMPADRDNTPVVMESKRLMESCGDDIGIPLKVSVTKHPEHWGKGVSL